MKPLQIALYYALEMKVKMIPSVFLIVKNKSYDQEQIYIVRKYTYLRVLFDHAIFTNIYSVLKTELIRNFSLWAFT